MGDLQLVKKFKVNDGFFGRYEKLVKDVVLPYQEKALNDQIEVRTKVTVLRISVWLQRS